MAHSAALQRGRDALERGRVQSFITSATRLGQWPLRGAIPDGTLPQQVKAPLRTFYHRIQDEGLRIDRTVTHGISCSIYFYDPEDNRIELYYKTGYDIRQPLGESIDLDQPNEELLAFSKSFETTMGPARGPVSA